MKKFAILSILCLILLNSLSFGQSLTPQQALPNQWIKSWLICGPIPLKEPADVADSWGHLNNYTLDYLLKTGGERNLHAKSGDQLKLPKGSVKWKLYNSPDSTIRLDKILSRDPNLVAYAYTEVESTEAKIMLLCFGTNDGGSLWVNGMQVWDYPPRRGMFVDDDMIPVALNKGKNTILFKIEQRANQWGYCVRFKPFSTAELLKKGDIFNISAGEDGKAKLTSKFMTPVLQQILAKLSIEVQNSQKTVVQSTEFSTEFTRALELKSNDYQAYSASIKLRLKNGELLTQAIPFYAGKRQIHTLFANGKSDYRIALSRDASESEQWAAKELQHWIKEIGGAELPIEQLDAPHNGAQFVIGYNAIVQQKTGVNKPAELDESFRYFNSGSDILIYGGKARGTMYGVMAYLENELGCRWYTPTVSVIPKRTESSFDWIDHSEKPGIRVRNDFYFEAFNPTWAARNRMNGTLGFDKSNPQIGGTENYWAVHTFYPLMPPEEFYKKHPEYYSLIDGKRIFERAQLCITNADVLKIIIERIKKRMRESPEYLIYDVSQNDWHNPCQCDKCQAIVKREGSESGLMIWFVNQVAQAVEKEFPDKFIGTLAYQYTRTPPTSIHPRNNVVVRLCSIECCFAHDFKSCPENKSFINDLKKWSALAPHLYIWDYVVNFSHYVMPYPNFRVLQPNIQTLSENNAIGIMEQASYQARGGEFSELKAYLISRLLWNPKCNTESVINDFMFGYYGRSGKLIREYFDLVQNRVTPDTHIHLGTTPEDPLFSDEFIRQSCDLFNRAIKVADNDEVVKRVELTYLPILYLKCKRTPALAKYDGTYAKFCEIAKREGVTYYAEAGEPHRQAFHKSVETAKE